jgi:5-methylcytosine-specific restriction protein A
MKNPPWTRDEHILALDFYLKHLPVIPGKDSREIQELSKLLNSLNSFLEHEKTENFRNLSGVYMKLMNFRRFDPSYTGTGLAHGNKDEEVVWNLYAHQPQELSKIAAHIRQFASSPQIVEIPSIPEDEEEGNEGQVLSRIHRYRERDKMLVQRKKLKFLTEHSRLFCQCCGFDFEVTYGARGKDFIECHHTKPVSELAVGEKTRLTDLVLLCSNCHRIVHRKKPWLGIDELREIVQKHEQ